MKVKLNPSNFLPGYKKLRIRRAVRRQQLNRTDYKCMECDETFCNRQELRQHNRMHDAECSFKCNDCGRYFRSKASRRQHRSMHTGELPYACPLCEKSFRLRNSLKSHLVGHTQGPKAGESKDQTQNSTKKFNFSFCKNLFRSENRWHNDRGPAHSNQRR